MRTSVFSVAGSPSCGSRWRKSVTAEADCQSGSLRVPSSFGACSTGAASATSGSSWGAGGSAVAGGRAPACADRDSRAKRITRYGRRPEKLRGSFFTRWIGALEPENGLKSTVEIEFRTIRARGLKGLIFPALFYLNGVRLAGMPPGGNPHQQLEDDC